MTGNGAAVFTFRFVYVTMKKIWKQAAGCNGRHFRTAAGGPAYPTEEEGATCRL